MSSPQCLQINIFIANPGFRLGFDLLFRFRFAIFFGFETEETDDGKALIGEQIGANLQKFVKQTLECV